MLLLAAWAPAAAAQLTSLETHDLRLVYQRATQGSIAPYAARCFENSFRLHRRLFDYIPDGKVTVVLNDFSDLGNAAAGAVPRDILSVNLAPISFAFETYPANERIYTLMNHELVHVATLDQATGGDRFFRHLFFGKVREIDEHPETIVYNLLTNPRSTSPRWYREGIAVFIETWMAGGYGRAQGAYDEMVFRAMVRDSSRFYDPIGLESEGSHADFQGGVNSYLYGTRFMSYLAYRYGPDRLIDWTARRPGSRATFAAQFRHVFDISLDQGWRDWIAWEHEFQRTNLDSISQYPTTPYRDVSRRPLGSISRDYLSPDRRTLYAAVNYPGEVGHLAAISLEDGSIRKLCDVTGPAYFVVCSVAYDPDGNRLFYTTDNYAWRDLREVDLATGKNRQLQKDDRIGDLAYSRADSALYGIRTFNALCTLVRMKPPYTEWHRVHTWPYGDVIYDIDVSPDGKKLSASMAEVNGRQTLRLFDLDRLAAGDTAATAVLGFGTSLPSNFVFSPDGSQLFGSSYYTGVSNIFRYDIAADSLDVMTNAETGFFRPIPLGADSVLALRYTGEGFMPSVIPVAPKEDVSAITFLGEKIAEERPLVRTWGVGSPASVPLDSLVTKVGPYHAFRSIHTEAVYPIVEGYKNLPAYGLHAALSDPIFMDQVGISATVTPNPDLPDNERVHLALDFKRYDWTVTARRNYADFYDLFGPTKVGLKGNSLELGYDRKLIYDEPRTLAFTADVTGYSGLERLPDAQNVVAPYTKLLSGEAKLDYKDPKYSLGSLDPRKGREWTLAANMSYVNRRGFPGFYGAYGRGLALPIPHSSLWLRGAAGMSPGDRTNPFANFYFGGFGNNGVDHGSIKRFQEIPSFPGMELNEAGGTNFGKVLLEWNLPPWRFRRIGMPSFYLSWIRASLFAGGLTTNIDDPASIPRRSYTDAGVQVDLRFTLLARHRMTLSFGYAGAFGDARSPSDEGMVSLKIL